jgi:quinol monooxygenase YgiN
MATSFVRQRVQDYDAWRRVYDEVAGMQQQGGVTDKAVYRDRDDANVVLVMHRFATMGEAEAFFASPDLRAAMQRGGVVGEPRIEYYEET